jgi:hypothetical protein
MKARAKRKGQPRQCERGTGDYKTALDMRHYTPIAMHFKPSKCISGLSNAFRGRLLMFNRVKLGLQDPTYTA